MRKLCGVTTMIIMCLFIRNAYTSTKTVLTFKQALSIAYCNNPELRVEMDKAQAMKGYFIQSKQFPNPQIGLMSENIGGSGSFKGFESAETTLSVTQPIPLGHRLKYLQNATYADYLTSCAQIRLKKAMLYIDVGQAYIDAYYTEQWKLVTKKLTRVNQDIVSEIKRRVTAGAGAELELRLAQVQFGEAKILHNKARRHVQIKRAVLARVMGNGITENRQLVDKGLSHNQRYWSEIKKKIPQSPKMLAQKRALRAKRATITAVKKSVWPNLNIQLGGRHFSDDGENAAVVSTSAQLPLFDRNQGKIVTAEAEYTQSKHELDSVFLRLRQDLYSAFIEAKQAHYESNLVSNSLLPLAEEALKLANERYQRGKFTYVELSLALNTLIEEERHYQQAHADYHKAAIMIEGLLGITNS